MWPVFLLVWVAVKVVNNRFGGAEVEGIVFPAGPEGEQVTSFGNRTFAKTIGMISNNDIMKKLRVALQLRNDEIMEIMKLVDFKVTESELGAIFRKEDHPKYKKCGDQFLRNFLNGLVIHMRGDRDAQPSVPQQKPEKEASAEDNDKMSDPGITG